MRPNGRGSAGIADPPQLLTNADALDVLRSQSVFEAKVPRTDQRAHHVGGKTRALLIGENRNRKWPSGHDPMIVQGPNGLDCPGNAVQPIEPSARCDRIDVRAAHDWRPVFLTCTDSEDIAQGIDMDRKADPLELFNHQIAS